MYVCLCVCMVVCVSVCVYVCRGHRKLLEGSRCQVNHRSRVRAFGLCSSKLWFSPLLLLHQQARGCPTDAAWRPKGLLCRETAAWQGEKESCESITLLAVGLVVTKGQA